MPGFARPEGRDGFAGIEALRPAARSLVAHLLRERVSHADVEDCTNEAFRRALEDRARLQVGTPVRPWLLGIARHVALDTLRARRRAALRDDELASNPAVERVADPTPGPDAHAERREQARHIRTAMERLPEQSRQALLLFHVEGLGYREIAEHMDVPVGTVGTWVMRGRQRLATALAEREHES